MISQTALIQYMSFASTASMHLKMIRGVQYKCENHYTLNKTNIDSFTKLVVWAFNSRWRKISEGVHFTIHVPPKQQETFILQTIN